MKFWRVRLLSIIGAVGACFLLQFLATSFCNEYYQRLIILGGLFVTLAVSLNLINGICGQFSVGHAAFYQVGAYGAGYLGTQMYKTGTPLFLWAVLLAVVGFALSAVAGLVVGLPSLRLKGDYLAIVTLGFGEILRIIVQNVPAVGGSYGYNVKPQFVSIGLVWMLAVICIAVCRNLLKSVHGLAFLAVREDEVASLAMGVNVTLTKVMAFVIGAAFAGSAGALFGMYDSFITNTNFGMDVSFMILTMVVLGGTGSITGSAVTAIFLSTLPELLRNLKDGDGKELLFPVPFVVAGLIGIAATVAIVKIVSDGRFHEKSKRQVALFLSVPFGLCVFALVRLALASIPSVAKYPPASGSVIRMVIFSVTLIIVMLLRPQGIFAHHEFGWHTLRRIFRRKKQVVEAAS